MSREKSNIAPLAESEITKYLMVYAKTGQSQKIEALIKQLSTKIDINATETNSGRTAAHYAAIYGHTDVLVVLSKYNADMSIVDRARFTPMDYALIIRGENQLTGLPDKDAIDFERARIINDVNDRAAKSPQLADFQITYVADYQTLPSLIKSKKSNRQDEVILYIILLCPPCLSQSTDSIHVTPIYYYSSKSKKEDIFFIADSCCNNYCPMPIVNPNHNTQVFYSPFQMQATGAGCFYYAIHALTHCHLDSNLISFLKRTPIANIKEIDAPLFQNELVSISNNRINSRYPAIPVLSDLQKIAAISKLPDWMVLYVEHYKLMRYLCVTEAPLCSFISKTFPERLKLRDLKRQDGDFNFYRYDATTTVLPVEEIVTIHEKLNASRKSCVTSGGSLFREKISSFDEELKNKLLTTLSQLQISPPDFNALLDPINRKDFSLMLRRACVEPKAIMLVQTLCEFYLTQPDVPRSHDLQLIITAKNSKGCNSLDICQEYKNSDTGKYLGEVFELISKSLTPSS